MKKYFLILFLAGCAQSKVSTPTMPPLPLPGSSRRISAVSLPPHSSVQIPFSTPVGMNTSLYRWRVEVTTNFLNWDFYCGNTNQWIGVAATQPDQFFRLVGEKW